MQNTGKLTDIHCHAAGVGFGGSGCYVSPRLKRNWRYRVYLAAYGLTESDLEREGDGVVLTRLAAMLGGSRRVGRAVVLALDCAVDSRGRPDLERTELYVPNAFVAREARRHGNLLFGASVNTHRADWHEHLDEAAELGAVLVKWLPPVQGIDPADARHKPFYRALADLKLVLLAHTGPERSFTVHQDALGDPARLRLPLETGVTVIAAHCGGRGKNAGVRNFDSFAEMAGSYPNLYGDVSGMTQINLAGNLVRAAANERLRGRLLYGSDMPLSNTLAATPLALPHHLPLREIRRLLKIQNPFDRDVAVKEALGLALSTEFPPGLGAGRR